MPDPGSHRAALGTILDEMTMESGTGLYSLLRTGFADRSDRPFLSIPDGRVWTYREIDDLSAAIAGALVEAGGRPGDRMLVQVAKSAENVALYLAALRTGMVYLPLNTAYTTSEVGFFAEDAEPAVAVVSPERLGDLDPVLGSAVRFTLSADGSGSLIEASKSAVPMDGVVSRAPDDVAAMLYTSGTTGRSKGAMLTVSNLASNALALHRIWAWEPGDVLLHVLPIFHVHGLFVALHCAMLNGSEVIFAGDSSAATMRSGLERATVMMGVPTHYVRLLADAGFGARECAGVRVFISGSAPMTVAVHREFEHRTGHRILERYGMTEAGMITSNPYDGDRIAGTVGYPLPDVEIRVVGAEGREVQPDTPGDVEVRGPNVFAGYWNLPEKTGAAFRDGGWFRTGDIGSVDGSGRLTLAGRSSDMIISGGLNVYPREVERCLDETPGVSSSAVVGLPHPELGEAVVAFVVSSDPDLTTDALAASAAGLARFKQPKRYVFVDELPRNAMGKLQKNVLRDSHGGMFGG